jgi:hypothetical protein
MGLDVYLYKYAGSQTLEKDREELEKHGEAMEEIWSQAKKEIAGDPVMVMEKDPLFGVEREIEERLTSEQYDEIKKLSRKRQAHYIEQNNLHIDVGDWGPEIKEEQIEFDSDTYPEHMFKIGYMRSSYNSGGFNSVVSKLVGHDLYWLFGVEGVDEYHVRPDWKTAKVRVGALIDQLKMDPGYNVMRISTDNMFSPTFTPVGEFVEERDTLRNFMEIVEDGFETTEEFYVWKEGRTLLGVVNMDGEHIVLFKGENGKPEAFMPKNGALARKASKILEEKQKESNAFSSFACKDGDFFLDGIEVKGMTSACGFGGMSCLDFITKDDENNEWYLHAAEIVEEMIDWVLAHDDPSEYYFHWSG